MSCARLSWVAALWLLAGMADARAQQYSFRNYGAAEGLENLAVLKIEQDGAGFIWAGTEAGLYRYDGKRFRLVAAGDGLPCATEVRSMLTADDGAIWVNACSGVFRFDGHRFSAVKLPPECQSRTQTLANGAAGRVLVGTGAGLFEVAVTPRGFSASRYAPAGSFAAKSVRGVLRSGAQVWFGCERKLCKEESGQVTVYDEAAGLPLDNWDGFAVTPDGSLWARSRTKLYRLRQGESRFEAVAPAVPANTFWGTLKVMRDGTLLVPTDRGLAIRKAGGWELVNHTRGLSRSMVAAVLEDRDGSLWLGLAGAGLARWLGRGEWEGWTAAQGLGSDMVWSVRRAHDGALWVGTDNGVTRIGAKGRIRSWTRADGLGGDAVRSLAETPDGTMWVVTNPGALAKLEPGAAQPRRIGAQDGLSCEPLRESAAPDGRLWVATTCGIFRNGVGEDAARFVRIKQPEDLQRAVWEVVEDRSHVIWATNSSGLWRYGEGHWNCYRKAQGLASDDPYIIVLAPDGALWLRHRLDASLERVEFSGSRIVNSRIAVAAAPTSSEVTASHGFDAWGRIWRGGANGVSVLNGKHWVGLTVADGLIWNDCNGEAFWADPDGSVWFGTSGGLAHYRPPDRESPRPLIANPIISRLTVTQASRLVMAEFSSLNYKAGQRVHFGYRVDDGEWTVTNDPGVSIAGLLPGRHRLEVDSMVLGGGAAAQTVVAEFELQARWQEKWWARLLLGIALVALLSGGVYWRGRYLESTNRKLDRLVRTRTKELEAAEALERARTRLLELVARDTAGERLAAEMAAGLAAQYAEASCFVVFDLPSGRVTGGSGLSPDWLTALSASSLNADWSLDIHDRLSDLSASPEWQAALATGSYKWRSCCAVPVLRGEDAAGTLVVFFAQAAAEADARYNVLLNFSQLAALALDRRRFMSELQHRANFDPLTQIPNRANIYERLDFEIKRAASQGGSVALFYLDLDGFKPINDTYGHEAGDTVLRESALRMRHSVRQGDTVGRVGGDEFVIVLPGIGSRENAERVAATVADALSAPIVVGGIPLHVGTSLGIALFPLDAGDSTHLLQAADASMYRQKQWRKRGHGTPAQLAAL